MEAQVLAACLVSREAQASVERLGGEADLSSLGQQIYKRIRQYYEADSNASRVDVPILLKQIQAALPQHYEKFEAAINNLPEGSPANLLEAMKATRLADINGSIIQALSDGRADEARTLMQQWQEIDAEGIAGTESGEPEVLQGVTIMDLLPALEQGSAFKLLPAELNELVAGLLPGDHIIVFGQVNRGKSAVVINLAAGFASQGHRTLYIGNEDPTERMLMRIICRFCGKTKEQVLQQPEHYTELAMKRGYGNLMFKSMSPGTVADVGRLLAEYKPAIVIIDQARNLVPSGKHNSGTDQQEAIFYELRMLLKRHRVLGISCTQAGEKDLNGKPLEKKLKLEQNDVYGSKSGVASQADIMIGIGALGDMLHSGQRYLNVCKNKASGIHEGVMVQLDPFTGIVRAIG